MEEPGEEEPRFKKETKRWTIWNQNREWYNKKNLKWYSEKQWETSLWLAVCLVVCRSGVTWPGPLAHLTNCGYYMYSNVSVAKIYNRV